MNKLALGTVQFGIPYGIANQTGQVSREETQRILALAHESGIDTLDTAISYGTSESLLGDLGTCGFKVITKLPALPEVVSDIEGWVEDNLLASLRSLQVDSVYGLLLHRSNNLLKPAGQALWRALDRARRQGLAKKIGVSIYSPHELADILRVCAIDLVQAPLNVIDRRLYTSGWLDRLHEQGIEVHLRSIFLQGLLLMKRSAIPDNFKRWDAIWNAWHEGLVRNNINAVTACLSYALSVPHAERVVVGVDTSAQLRQLITIASAPNAPVNWSGLVCEDEFLINPSKWSLL